MIASYKCSGQTIPTDTTVLKYLYKEAASAYYLRIDTTLRAKETKFKDSLLFTMNSQIANRDEALKVCELEKTVKDTEINTLKDDNKKLSNKYKFYQFTTLLAILTTIISLFK